MNLFKAYTSTGKTGEDRGKEQARFAREYPLRILIADDNYINRRVLFLFLQRLGYKPTDVENGVECLKAVLDHPFDLILTDINMPEMDGLECATAIRAAGIDTPIVAITADSGAGREHCYRAGMTGYMTKPVNLEELQNLLRATFQEKSGKNRMAEETHYSFMHALSLPITA